MAIENRNLEAGTRLVATYKKQTVVCTVEVSADGERNEFVLEDGKRFKSPSAAGTAVIGTACNGWRFWSIEGEAPVTATTKAKAATVKPVTRTSALKKPRTKSVKVFYRIPNQKGTAEGMTRFYCNGCAASFESESDSPEACPQGHRNDDAELTSAPAGVELTADQAETTAE